MPDYHVGCGLVGVYAGTLKKSGVEWLHKSDVTTEAMCAVAQRLLFDDKEFRFKHEDKWYVMRVEEMEEDEKGGGTE